MTYSVRKVLVNKAPVLLLNIPLIAVNIAEFLHIESKMRGIYQALNIQATSDITTVGMASPTIRSFWSPWFTLANIHPNSTVYSSLSSKHRQSVLSSRNYAYAQGNELMTTSISEEDLRGVFDPSSHIVVVGESRLETELPFVIAMTDINPEFGHKIPDATEMRVNNKYDLVLCLNVLEHIYDFEKAINNIYRIIKDGGTLVIAVPFAFPTHDEPADYWRLTEHALRKLLKDFSRVETINNRFRRLPTGYFVKVLK